MWKSATLNRDGCPFQHASVVELSRPYALLVINGDNLWKKSNGSLTEPPETSAITPDDLIASGSPDYR